MEAKKAGLLALVMCLTQRNSSGFAVCMATASNVCWVRKKKSLWSIIYGCGVFLEFDFFLSENKKTQRSISYNLSVAHIVSH